MKSLTLTQRLIKKTAPLPFYLILISPVMDCSFKNESITDLTIPILWFPESALKCHNGDLEDPVISSINGDFLSFPRTLLFIARNDITSPDRELFATKLEKVNVAHKIIRGKGMLISGLYYQ